VREQQLTVHTHKLPCPATHQLHGVLVLCMCGSALTSFTMNLRAYESSLTHQGARLALHYICGSNSTMLQRRHARSNADIGGKCTTTAAPARREQ
jgi:hypothetical protein